MPATRMDIEQRRRTVWELVLRGVPETVIATTLGVHRNTIVNDMRVIKGRHREAIKDVDIQEEIGDAVAKFDEAFKMAVSEYSTVDVDKPLAKAHYLGQILNALNSKVNFLVKVGVLPQAAQEFTGNLTVEGMSLNNMSLEKLKDLRGQLVERWVGTQKA